MPPQKKTTSHRRKAKQSRRGKNGARSTTPTGAATERPRKQNNEERGASTTHLVQSLASARPRLLIPQVCAIARIRGSAHAPDLVIDCPLPRRVIRLISEPVLRFSWKNCGVGQVDVYDTLGSLPPGGGREDGVPGAKHLPARGYRQAGGWKDHGVTIRRPRLPCSWPRYLVHYRAPCSLADRPLSRLSSEPFSRSMFFSSLFAASLAALAQLAAAANYSNPLRQTDGSDPQIVWHDGYYYLMTTTWTDVQLTRATTLEGLKTGERKTVWVDEDPSRCCSVWAPGM